MGSSNIDMERELLEAKSRELQAIELALQAERAEFNAEKLQWQITTGGSPAKVPSDHQLEAERAKLDVDRLQLEAEKTQLKVAQSELVATEAGLQEERLRLETEKNQQRVKLSQLMASQSQLEAAKFRLGMAQTQLEKAREDLEIARKHLEDAKAQTDINTLLLEAAKASLGAAKMRFDAATKQLNVTKTLFEVAKARLDQASSSIAAEKSHLEDDKAALEIKVSKVESEKAQLEMKVSQLESDKFELGYDLQESKAENERLLEKLKGVEKQLDQCNEDKKTLIQTKRGNKPKVFLDLEGNGRIPVRVVIELDYDTTPLTAENFRALCTGEKGISQSSGRPLHYKGTTLACYGPHWFQEGGDDGPLEGDSIYGSNFPQENFIKEHDRPGIVCMNKLPGDTNGSQFLISNNEFSMFDGYNVAFGEVVEGMDVMIEMMEAGLEAAYVIVECGEL